MPFCQASRLTTPKSSASGSVASPKCFCSAAFVQAPQPPRLDRIRRRKPRILLRIPYGVVDTIENSGQ